MSDEVRNALLVFVGSVLVLIVVDGSYVRYVRPGAGPLLLGAGVVVVVLALVDVVRDLRGLPPADTGHAHDGSDPRGRSDRIAWLLLAPVLTVLLVAPPALGSDAVVLAGDRTAPVAAPAEDPLPPGPAPPLALVDFVARTAAAPTGADAPSLAGREVTLTGFLVPAREGPGTDLVRLVVSCCAADASPVRVHLADPAAVVAAAGVAGTAPPVRAGAPAERWVRLRGGHVPGTGGAADGFVPTLRVTAAGPAAPAVPPYEY